MASVFTANQDSGRDAKWIGGGRLYQLHETRPLVHRVEVPPGSGKYQEVQAGEQVVLIGVLELDADHAAALGPHEQVSVAPVP